MTLTETEWVSRIHHGDCLQGLNRLPNGSIDLAFADPPFNIGYEYDVYKDDRECRDYLDWSSRWISSVYDVLSPSGAFWLAIGDEYAAELKLTSQEIGFHCRSWVIWYYTFGVNCAKKFTRSHAHLFHFVKDPANFTFLESDLDNRVPSARELVYNDKRANPKGRLPDDTWILPPAGTQGELVVDGLEGWTPSEVEPPSDRKQTFALRPQELENCFHVSEDTWYMPRVAGTFKERAGFHGCQMPEQLLGRIIRICSSPGDIVLDPFSGSATTLAVAKKLGRQFIGFDVSEEYVKHGRARLDSVKVGDRLDGSPEPLKSALKSPNKTSLRKKKGHRETQQFFQSMMDDEPIETRYEEIQRELTQLGVVEAFRMTHDGHSADRVVADPDLNGAFLDACTRLGLVGDARTWNFLLFNGRKAGRLSEIPTRHRTTVSWNDVDHYIFASEIAWQQMLDDGSACSLDEILCDPVLATTFDKVAREFAPGHSSLDYRWGALIVRKEAKVARTRAAVLTAPRFREMIPIVDASREVVSNRSGLYVISGSRSERLHVGETLDLWERIKLIMQQPVWNSISDSVFVQTLAMDHSTAGHLAWQSCLVKEFEPRLNCFELRSAS